MRHLLWLIGRTLRNRMAGAVGRLKHPRYAIAAAVAVAYFALLFGPQLALGTGTSGMPRMFSDMGALALAFWLLFWWLRGGYEEALAFDPAEVHHLFPAPLSRATLIRYKLLRAQAGVIPTAVFLWLFMGAGRAVPWYLGLPAAWLMIETLHLHQVGASLVRVTARQGAGGIRRVAAPLLLITVIGVAVVWAGAAAFAAARSEPDLAAALAASAAALERPVPALALAPFRALLAPAFATAPAELLRALPVALLLLAAHYLWVVRTDAAFEEAAADAGRRRARIREAVRRGRAIWKADTDAAEARRWIRLPLRPTGEPAVALLWKHVTAFTGEIRPLTVALGLAGAAGVAGIGAAVGGSARAGALALGFVSTGSALLLMGFGPVATRLDLRRDLEALEALRTYPIDPRWLVLAELAAPTLVILTGYIGLLVLVGLSILVAVPPELLAPALAALLLALAAGPPLVALQVAIHNLIALLFPDWVRIGAVRAAGFDAMGQSILTFLAAALLFIALLIPPLVLGGLVAVSFGGVLRAWAALPGLLTALTCLWLEVALLGRWLARLYHRLDPAEAGLLG